MVHFQPRLRGKVRHASVNGEVRDDHTVQTNSTSTIATPTLSSNGKQINGWDLKPGSRTVAPPSTATHTDPGARAWMIAGAVAGQDVSQSTSTSHYIDGTGLTVTGTLNGMTKTVALPNTPVL